jgi:hypothetical protein
MEKLIKSAIYKRLALEDSYNGEELEYITEKDGKFIYLVKDLLCSYDGKVTITKISPL